MNTSNFWELHGKKQTKLPPQSGFHSRLEAVEPHQRKRAIKSFFHKKEHLRFFIDL